MILDDGYDISGSGVEFNIHYSMTMQSVPPDGNEGSHGNKVISAASGMDNSWGYVGVANEARIVIADISSAGQSIGWEGAAASFIDAAVAGTRVISVSFSTKNWTSPSAPSSFLPLRDAIANAYYQRGTLVTASTGNQQRSDWYAFPAAWPEVIGVGGSGYSDEYQLNNYAPGNVEIAAPAIGVGVICKGGAQKSESDGTSYATPMVAGALMILREYFPTETISQIRDRLAGSAVPMSSTQLSGAGRMDLLSAVQWSAPPPPSVSASISGNTEIEAFMPCSWGVVASGGTPPYSYSWKVNGQPAGDNSESLFYMNDGNPFNIAVTVTDQAAQEGHASHDVAIVSGWNCT